MNSTDVISALRHGRSLQSEQLATIVPLSAGEIDMVLRHAGHAPDPEGWPADAVRTSLLGRECDIIATTDAA